MDLFRYVILIHTSLWRGVTRVETLSLANPWQNEVHSSTKGVFYLSQSLSNPRAKDGVMVAELLQR